VAPKTVLNEGEEIFERAETQLAACRDFFDISMERAFGGVSLFT